MEQSKVFKSQAAEAMLKALKNPFPVNLIHFRIGAKNKTKDKAIPLAYLTMRDIQKRLDEVCGIDGWAKNSEVITSQNGLIAVRTTIQIKMPSGEWVAKDGIGEATKIAGPLGAESQSFKRAAVAWGISRYMYFINLGWKSIDDYGNFKEDLTKVLPNWAYPESKIENWEEVAELEYQIDDTQSFIEDEPSMSDTQATEDQILQKSRNVRNKVIEAAKRRKDSDAVENPEL